MLTAIHALIYSDDPAATRRFFADVLRWPFVSEGDAGDAGLGGDGTGGSDPSEWLIFGTGPSELGVHPTVQGEWSGPRHHQVALMCDDLAATMEELAGRGAEFTGEPQDQGYGLTVGLKVPGADDLLLYQARHALAHSLPARSGASAHRHHEAPVPLESLESSAEPAHGGRRLPVTETEWNEHYAPEVVWSGDPNGALVPEVTGLAPGRAVDVGCGEGADAVWLASQGWQVTAFDVAGSALERGRAAADAAGVSVEWKRAGLLSADLPAAAFDLVTACYPALARTPEQLAERALLALVAPGGRLVMLAHAELDDEEALAHGFNPDDYVFAGELLAAVPDGWSVERNEQRPRSIAGGAGAGHTTDTVLVLRRNEETA